MSDYYILNKDHSVTQCNDSLTWAKDFENTDRRVVQEYIGEYLISTVFLGLNHAFDDGPPQLFETMVFKGSESDLLCGRCATWDEALAQHARVCEQVRSGNVQDRE